MNVNDVTDLNHLSRSEDKNVAYAAIRLQLAILTGMAKQLRSKLPRKYKLVDGLTQEEAKYARMENYMEGLFSRSGKIQAIKMVRERTNADLRTAKDFVETWMERHLGFKNWTDKAYTPKQMNNY